MYNSQSKDKIPIYRILTNNSYCSYTTLELRRYKKSPSLSFGSHIVNIWNPNMNKSKEIATPEELEKVQYKPIKKEHNTHVYMITNYVTAEEAHVNGVYSITSIIKNLSAHIERDHELHM
ncbi:12037_t:CDS:2, partial [Dentiscutata heterogama]